MTTDVLRGALAGMLLLTFTLAQPGDASAKEYNFAHYAGKKGCASIVFSSTRSDCHSRSSNKGRACNRKLDCDVSKAGRLKDKYKRALENLKKKAGTKDEDSAKRSVATLKRQLNDMKDIGKRGYPMATSCVRARSKVQSLFKRVIPRTKTVGDNAVRKRKKLLDRLKRAREDQKKAKSAKDAKTKDSSLKRKWEDAKKKVREIEKQLERFNKANGKQIKRYVSKLVRKYEDGRRSHVAPKKQAQQRADNCKTLMNLSF